MSPFTPGAGKKYIYTFRLVAPDRNELLHFEDSRIKVDFTVDEAAIGLRLQNTTTDILRILWGGVVLGIDNRFHRVRHGTDLYTDSLDVSPFPLPAGGNVRDLILPATSVRRIGDVWTETPLFRTTDNDNDTLRAIIMGNVGRIVRVRLPLECPDGRVDYEFAFEIAAVTSVPWRDITPHVREPRPPEIPKSLSKNDQVVAITIVVGFLGMFALLVSADKDPPSE